MKEERIHITRNPKTREPDYIGKTPSGDTELSGFASDIAHEVAYGLMEDTAVETVEITLRWTGEY